MDDLLVPIRTSKTSRPLIIEELSHDDKPAKAQSIKTLSDAVQSLKNEPDWDALKSIVKYLDSTRGSASSILLPSPTTTQIVNTLVTEVIPNYWHQLEQDTSKQAPLPIFVKCLKSLPALGAILARLKALISESKAGTEKDIKSSFLANHFMCLLDLLTRILQGNDFVLSNWNYVETSVEAQGRKTLIWKELVTMLSSGRVVAIVSEAEDCHRKLSADGTKSWMGYGDEYAQWLATNITKMASESNGQDKIIASCSLLLGKTLSFGYTDVLVQRFLESWKYDDRHDSQQLILIMTHLRPFESKTLFSTFLRLIDKRLAPAAFDSKSHANASLVPPSEVAGFLKSLIMAQDSLADALFDTLAKPESSGRLLSPALLQCAVSAICSDKIRITTLLETSLRKFCDELSITHSPVLHQEFNVMLLLLVAGYFSRHNMARLKTLIRSSEFMSSISKHLASNSIRVKWLGMIVATGLSRVVDQSGASLNFDDESLKTKEAKWYLDLLKSEITPSKTASIQKIFGSVNETTASSSQHSNFKQINKQNTKSIKGIDSKSTASSKSRIIEMVDIEDDIIPYAKPDSDPEDEEEDPTLVNREKPKPPVYIRDLIKGLGDQENIDQHSVALSEAAPLIRRKSGYGKEVLDNEEELASVLMNLQDNFEIENFATLKQEALIALLLANPASMAKRYARALFGGDYSLQSRLSILAAIGLGARELAGHKDEGRVEQPSFPSKQLPKRLHDKYSDSAGNLNRIASRLQQSIVQPMAIKAADEVTGPNALKVRTFSSRIEVERTKKRPEANKLAKISAESFFMPLTGGWWMNQSSASGIYSMPEFVSTYIRTLAVILDASGPWTIALPQMSLEFWDLLLSMRSRAFANKEYNVLESLLFGLLILLEVNQENNERMAKEHAKEVVETQEWARLLLNRLDSSDAQGAKIHALAAAVLFRCGEIVERWHRLMVGDMIDV